MLVYSNYRLKHLDNDSKQNDSNSIDLLLKNEVFVEIQNGSYQHFLFDLVNLVNLCC